MREDVTIIENKTSAKTMARRLAVESDCGLKNNRYLVPVCADGHGAGHATAWFFGYYNNRYGFSTSNYGVVWFDSLQEIYLI